MLYTRSKTYRGDGLAIAVLKNALRQCRRTADLTQADLAKALGVSRQTVNSIETGRYQPSIELALRLAGYFSRPLEELFWLEED